MKTRSIARPPARARRCLAVLLLAALAFVVHALGPAGADPRHACTAPKAGTVAPALFGIGTVEARRSYLIGPTAAGRVRASWPSTSAIGSRPASCWPRWIRSTSTSAWRRWTRRSRAPAAPSRRRDAQRQDARAKRELAAINARRYVDLGEKNFISASAVEAKLQEQTSADAGVSAAEANLAAAPQDRQRLAAERAGLRQQRANVRLLAPADGVVISRDAEPGSTVVAGQAVLRLIDPSSLWVKVRLGPGPLGRAWPPACRRRSCCARIRAQPLAGTVARVEAVSDSVTEERLAQVAFDQAPGRGVGRRTGRGDASAARHASAVLVPNASHPAAQATRSGVWLARRRCLRFVPVRLGQTSLDGQVQVLEGLKAGDAGGACTARRSSAPTAASRWSSALAGQAAMISLAGRDILHSWGKFVLTGIGLGLLIGVTLTMAGVYRGMVDDARVLLDNSGADLWVVQQDTQGPYAESSSLRDDAVRSVLGLPGVARAANVTYLTMQVRRTADASAGRARDGGRLRARAARRAGLPGGRPPHHAQPLRSGGRRAHRLRAGRPHPHPPPRLHRGRPDAAHGVVGRRPDGLHPAQGRAGSAVPEGQRRHPQRARPHRRQPGPQPARRAGPAGSGPGLAGEQPQRQRGAGAAAARRCRLSADTVAETDPPLEAPGGLHPRADGGDPGRQADRHLGAADRHVPGDPGHRQRGHRGLHHLHHDAGQDPRDRGAQADRHAQPHHRRDDPAAGAGAGPDRLRRRQDRGHLLGADLPEVRAAGSRRCRARASSR